GGGCTGRRRARAPPAAPPRPAAGPSSSPRPRRRARLEAGQRARRRRRRTGSARAVRPRARVASTPRRTGSRRRAEPASRGRRSSPGCDYRGLLGLLYDIHGNVPALDAVLADAGRAGVDRWLLGGDYGTPSPWPLETLARLRELDDATWIRGNGERWLREPPADRPEVMASYELFLGGLPEEEIDWLYALPERAELDGVLYVHGPPLSDVESFAPQPEEGEARMLAGVRDRVVVFGHR